MAKDISIIGGGFIGQQWSLLFAAQKYNVFIYEIIEQQAKTAEVRIRESLKEYITNDLSRSDEDCDCQLKRIKITTNYQDMPKNSEFVMECIPEDIDLKRKAFEDMDKYFSHETIRISSSSYIPISRFTSDLVHKSKCIIAHPVNPPYLLRLIEVVPGLYTDQCTILKTQELMKTIGQKPVLIKKEMYGFALNRIQSCVFNSVFKLIKDDIIDAKDADLLMTEGLGPRWAFHGPLSIAQMNGPGFENYVKKYLSSLDSTNIDQNFPPQHDENVFRKIGDEISKNDDIINFLIQKRNSNIGKIFKIKKDEQDLEY